MDPPTYSKVSSDCDINYIRNITDDQDNNLHHDRELRLLAAKGAAQ